MNQSCLHNLLTPVLSDGTFACQSNPAEPIIPGGRGDEQALELGIDVTCLWSGQMESCMRRIESPDMNRFTVIDQGRRLMPGAVAFHLHSLGPFEIAGRTAIVRRGDVALRIDLDWAEEIAQMEDGIDFNFRPVYHLIAKRQVAAKPFTLITDFERPSDK